ncbi:hypothetical protein C0J52_12973, partial [Blattella germanica]
CRHRFQSSQLSNSSLINELVSSFTSRIVFIKTPCSTVHSINSSRKLLSSDPERNAVRPTASRKLQLMSPTVACVWTQRHVLKSTRIHTQTLLWILLKMAMLSLQKRPAIPTGTRFPPRVRWLFQDCSMQQQQHLLTGPSQHTPLASDDYYKFNFRCSLQNLKHALLPLQT